jgi:transposase
MDAPVCQGCVALMGVVEQLRAEVAQLRLELAKTQAELAAAKKNSRNSSKPPSSDIVKKPKEPTDDGSKRKRGGQPGHEKHERQPFPDEQVAYDERHLLCCPDCHGPVVPSRQAPKVIEQIELPAPSETIAVVGIRAHAYWCRKCQQVHHAAIETARQRAGLVGPRLTTLIAYLKGACHCSYSTIKHFLREVFCINLSRGQLAKVVHKVSVSLQDTYATLAQHLPNQTRLNVDETGHKDSGQAMWTWCFRSSLFTLFKISPSRGSDVLLDVLGQEFDGVLGCDYFSAYRKYMKDCGVLVQFCLAHLLRDVRFLVEHPNTRNQAFGQRVLHSLRNLFAVIHRRDDYSPTAFQTHLQNAGEELWAEVVYRVPPTKEARNLAKRFEQHGESYLRFITTPDLEPTNNLAEQAIRFVVIDRKVTQGSRGDKGQRWLERIWTVMATCAQTGRSVFDFLHRAICAHFDCEPPPSLLPDSC